MYACSVWPRTNSDRIERRLDYGLFIDKVDRHQRPCRDIGVPYKVSVKDAVELPNRLAAGTQADLKRVRRRPARPGNVGRNALGERRGTVQDERILTVKDAWG